MDASRKHFRLALGLTLAALLLLAWHHRFIQDDAFISFRYAENLAAGKGLVWNAGERVEGYTNFLWTVLMTLPFLVGWEPVAFSYALGLGFFLVTLLASFRLAALVLRDEWIALAVVVLLGSNFTFSCYATGGLETQLQAALHCVAWVLVAQAFAAGGFSRPRLLGLSSVCALALLTRLDSALVVGPALVAAAWLVLRRGRRGRVLNLMALLFPLLASIGAWLVWKLHYYGDVLPNTYYAKVSSGTSLTSGLLYLYAFSVSYLLPPFLLLLLAALPALVRRQASATGLLLATSVPWCAYVASVGGDFMEFRLLVPVLPFLMLLFVAGSLELVTRTAGRAALLALMLLGSLNHSLTFMDANLPYSVYRVESVAHLQGHLTAPDSNWIGIGQALGRLFPAGGVVIAVNAAGAVPFYSRLPGVDMRGLTDKWVARDGRITGDRPGHQRMATAAYLVERGVNLVIAHPELRARDDRSAASLEGSNFLKFGGRLPDTARLVEIPIDARYSLVCIYLVPSPLVDEAIRSDGWRTYRL